MFKMIVQKKFFYVGPGRYSCHFIDVRDLCQAFILAMEKTNLNGGIYTIANDRVIPLEDAVNMIAD